MNEYSSEVAPYKDRSTGLMVFGVLSILLGCFSGLMVVFMILGQAMAANLPNAPQTDTRAILPAIFMYGGIGVALVWLGIGSIMACRWARALMLISSWSSLCVGVMAMVMMVFVLPTAMSNIQAAQARATGTGHVVLPESVMVITMIVMTAMIGVIFIVLPAIWIYFYSSRHVKATCEARNPMPSWTDACPLPVLAVSIWSVLYAGVMLLMPVSAHGVMPFFGMFIYGWTGSLLCVIIAAVWGYAAWLLYKVDVRGWWLVLTTLCVFVVSMALTYAQHDIMEVYPLMGYSQAQMDQIKQTGIAGNRMIWVSVLSIFPSLGYLYFIKRYFPAKA